MTEREEVRKKGKKDRNIRRKRGSIGRMEQSRTGRNEEPRKVKAIGSEVRQRNRGREGGGRGRTV